MVTCLRLMGRTFAAIAFALVGGLFGVPVLTGLLALLAVVVDRLIMRRAGLRLKLRFWRRCVVWGGVW